MEAKGGERGRESEGKGRETGSRRGREEEEENTRSVKHCFLTILPTVAIFFYVKKYYVESHFCVSICMCLPAHLSSCVCECLHQEIHRRYTLYPGLHNPDRTRREAQNWAVTNIPTHYPIASPFKCTT